MKLWSQAFADGEFIPEKYAFGKIDPVHRIVLSDNHSPDLHWEGVPAHAHSLALLCYDPDAPSEGSLVNKEGQIVPARWRRADFFHWVLIDLSPTLNGFIESVFSEKVTLRGKKPQQAANFGRAGLNDYTQWFAQDPELCGDYYGYDGPCPPWNDERIHRYVFTLYALDLPELAVGERFSGQEVKTALVGHVLAEASLTGLYTLNPQLVP